MVYEIFIIGIMIVCLLLNFKYHWDKQEVEDLVVAAVGDLVEVVVVVALEVIVYPNRQLFIPHYIQSLCVHMFVIECGKQL